MIVFTGLSILIFASLTVGYIFVATADEYKDIKNKQEQGHRIK